MKKRIIGIDVARALAIIGMIIVNFKVAFGGQGEDWLVTFAHQFEGKAAAIFVVLAGIGLALMTNSAIEENNQAKINKARIRIAKRALFLFVLGLSWIEIFTADILHYYGVYMAISTLLLTSKRRTILFVALSLILAYPVLHLFLDYDTGWDFASLYYQDFWTFNGFIRNLFFNGFHPVIPWTAFMLVGYWFGRQNLHNDTFIKKTLGISTLAFITIQAFSYVSILILSKGNKDAAVELGIMLGTSPMPPFPIYMLNGIAFALALISACILIAKLHSDHILTSALKNTGQLALTFYVAHVIIGMGLIDAMGTNKMGSYSIEFSVLYAIIFSLCCILFAVLWRHYYKSGPLEWVMRKVTG